MDSHLSFDLPLPRYLWDIAKSTTRAERLSCAAAIVVLAVCIILIVYFTVVAKKNANKVVDIAPHEWYITRKMWLAPAFLNDDDATDFTPVKLVIIAHTVSPECNLFVNCAAEMVNLQSYFTNSYNYDIPYNFVIGNEGRVYEGRGWKIIGAHTIGYNRCSLGVAFIVTELQLQRALMLLEKGVEHGYLDKDYRVVGAKDLRSSYSPGANLYKQIQKWPHYAHNNTFKGMTCEEIYNRAPPTTTSTLRTILDSDVNETTTLL
ncbi:hypothetical protein HF086_000171 [Spodoptera exigua]|uniref:Uncharacterized protein n=1 Tax=Spodoptera exigua TaxID=7107 RepID=A0A922M0L8_SPOEX|nr:hypothetical protein HF086_000171 [Spodoptera exigua]